MTAATERSVTIRYAADSLGDIDPQYYADMLEAMISAHFGGEYRFDIAPESRIGTRVYLAGEWGDDAEVAVEKMGERAFNACCRGEPVPQV